MVRFKNRYITVEVSSPTIPDEKPLVLKSEVLNNTVFSKVQNLHGDFGIAAIKSGFITKYCNEHTRLAILRVRHGPHRLVTSSLPFITKIGTIDAKLNTLHVGATMKHSFKFIQKHQRAYLDNMWSKLKTQQERSSLEAAVMDFTKFDITKNVESIS